MRRLIFNSSKPSVGNGEQAQPQGSSVGALKVTSGEAVVIDVTLVADTNIYADNDVLAISQIVTGVSDQLGGVVELVSAILFDGDDQGTEVECFFTTNSITPGTINGALSAADTVFDDIVGRAHFVTFNDLINSQNCVLTGLGQIMQCAADSKDLYVFAVVRSGTPTYTAAGLKLKLGFKRY